jgi:hypothetical protein
MEAGERELHFGLYAGDTHRPELRSLTGHKVEQGGLADASIATHHERPTLPCLSSFQERGEDLALAVPVDEVRPDL